MKKEETARKLMDVLSDLYPDALCSLEYESPFRLLVAVELSAQCTDARVNTVTPILFSRFGDAYAMASAPLSEVEEIIRPCGFYHNKAKNIIECSKKIVSDFGGKVPDNMEELLSLAGVGRKTANLVLGDVYKKGGMVIDTHAKRILNRAGLTDKPDPYQIEKETEILIPRSEQSAFCHRLVMFGRDVCSARKPHCEACPAKEFCPKVGVLSV